MVKPLLLWLLAFNACADIGIGVESHRYGGVLSYSTGRYSLVLLDRPYDGIGVTPLVMYQKSFGSKWYVKPGVGITKSTSFNSVLNFCTSIGYRIVEYTHCSNGGVYGLNYGLDFLIWKIKI